MNLFYDPSLLALRQPVNNANASQPVHNVAVDFDGEVIIDPELHFPNVDINRYMFHTNINTVENKENNLRSLFDKLLDAFNGNADYNGYIQAA